MTRPSRDRPLSPLSHYAAHKAHLDDGAAALVDTAHAVRVKTLADTVPNPIKACLDWFNCFPRETLVATETGPRPIGEIQPGERVRAYDFVRGQWVLADVTERHDNLYGGPIIKIVAGDTAIETTVYHPFWVVEGRDLSERPIPRSFSLTEDQGPNLPGRWVNSHDLRAGDVIFTAKGEFVRIEQIEQHFAEPIHVCNLTVADLHNYAVGRHGALVHNTSLCDDAADGAGKASQKGLLDDATRQLAEANIKNSGKTVLGPFFPEVVNYINKANVKNASFFDIGKSWDHLTDAQRWAANQHFLDEIADVGDQVLLSVSKGKIRPDSYLAKEIRYLTEVRGYKWANQWSLVPGR